MKKQEKTAQEFVHEWMELTGKAIMEINSFLEKYDKRENMPEKETIKESERLIGSFAMPKIKTAE